MQFNDWLDLVAEGAAIRRIRRMSRRAASGTSCFHRLIRPRTGTTAPGTCSSSAASGKTTFSAC